MNKFLAVLPLSLWVAGCGATPSSDTNAVISTSPATTNTVVTTITPGSSGSTVVVTPPEGDAKANDAQVSRLAASSTTKPKAKATAKPATKTTKKPTAKPAASGKPDPRYRVVDELPPGAPADMVAAVNAVKVPPPPTSMKVADKVRVRLQTSSGPVTLELNGKAAPLHVKSFVYLAQRGFFNGTVFHRHADLLQGSPDGKSGFIIQGGDPLSKKAQTSQFSGQGGPGYQIPRERNSLKHDKLVIAAARTQDPDSAGSQFYITQAPVEFLDEGDGYTVFGKVVEGAANALKLTEGAEIKSVQVLK
jgi:cyclophilin family peptidyl-prolyl cis-trans isomerase